MKTVIQPQKHIILPFHVPGYTHET